MRRRRRVGWTTKSSVSTPTTSASRSAVQDDGSPANCASTNEPYRASNSCSRGPACSPSTASTTNPQPASRSVSSAAVNSLVWNGFRGVSATGGEGEPVRGRDEQPAARTHDPETFAHELRVTPDVLDDLQTGDDVDGSRTNGKRGEIAPDEAGEAITRPGMRNRRRVVVDAEHRPRRPGQQVGAVTLAAAHLEHRRSRHLREEVMVGGLVAAEPVVLGRDARHGALAGERHRVGVGSSSAVRALRFARSVVSHALIMKVTGAGRRHGTATDHGEVNS